MKNDSHQPPMSTPTPQQRAQAIRMAAAMLARGAARLTTAQVEQFARTVAPLARAGLLSPEEQTRLAALLARHNRLIS